MFLNFSGIIAHPDPNREDILSLLLMARDEDGRALLKQQQLKLAPDRPIQPVHRGAWLGPSGGVPMMKIGQRDLKLM